MYPIAAAWTMTRTTSPCAVAERARREAEVFRSVHSRRWSAHASSLFLENLHSETPSEKVLSSSDELTVSSRRVMTQAVLPRTPCRQRDNHVAALLDEQLRPSVSRLFYQ